MGAAHPTAKPVAKRKKTLEVKLLGHVKDCILVVHQRLEGQIGPKSRPLMGAAQPTAKPVANVEKAHQVKL